MINPLTAAARDGGRVSLILERGDWLPREVPNWNVGDVLERSNLGTIEGQPAPIRMENGGRKTPGSLLRIKVSCNRPPAT